VGRGLFLGKIDGKCVFVLQLMKASKH